MEERELKIQIQKSVSNALCGCCFSHISFSNIEDFSFLRGVYHVQDWLVRAQLLPNDDRNYVRNKKAFEKGIKLKDKYEPEASKKTRLLFRLANELREELEKTNKQRNALIKRLNEIVEDDRWNFRAEQSEIAKEK